MFLMHLKSQNFGSALIFVVKNLHWIAFTSTISHYPTKPCNTNIIWLACILHCQLTWVDCCISILMASFQGKEWELLSLWYLSHSSVLKQNPGTTHTHISIASSLLRPINGLQWQWKTHETWKVYHRTGFSVPMQKHGFLFSTHQHTNANTVVLKPCRITQSLSP